MTNEEIKQEAAKFAEKNGLSEADVNAAMADCGLDLPCIKKFLDNRVRERQLDAALKELKPSGGLKLG